MLINGVWYSDPELIAYIKQLTQERDAYKQELIDTLRKACMCPNAEKDIACHECPYFYMVDDGEGKGCPTQLEPYAAKLRLEELLGGKTIC